MNRNALRSRLARASLTSVIAAGLATVAAATDWHVTVAGGGTGLSWASPTDLQTALGSALPGDEIWVKEGTYVPGALRTSTFAVPDDVALLGGFVGTETSSAARLGSFDLTILSGNVDGLPTTAGDAFHVVTVVGTFGVVVDGFKITLGNADNSGGASSAYGGGMTIPGGSGVFYDDVTLRNVAFVDNLAVHGGGLHAAFVANLNVDRCAFLSNEVRGYGGGAHLYSCASGSYCESSDGVKILRTSFEENDAFRGGGLYYDVNDGVIWIYNCWMYDNSAVRGGGLYGGDVAYPVRIGNTTIAHNLAYKQNGANPSGGGIHFDDPNANVVMFNSIVWGNVADFGGIFALGSSIQGPGASAPALTVEHSDVEIQPMLIGGGPFWPGPGNINADPVFVNAGASNLRLDAFSPCIDAADDTLVPFDFLDHDGDADVIEQMPRDFTLNMVREWDDAGVADTGVDDLGTDSYVDPICSTSSTGLAADVDGGVVDMGCYERRLDSM